MTAKDCTKHISPRVELRYDDPSRSDLDEIVLRDENGDVIFHMERMASGCIWAAIYPTKAAPFDDPNTDRVVYNTFVRSVVKCRAEIEPKAW